MASNKDLKVAAKSLAAELGIGLDFEGMKNEDLVKLVSDLKAKIKDRDTVTQADEAQTAPVGEEPPAEEPLAEESSDAYCVAPGKAITTMRGILADGDKITAKDLMGGQEIFDKLLNAGFVVED